MKKINKIKSMSIACCVLLIVSCMNNTENNASKLDSLKENQLIAVDNTLKSKMISIISEKEVIDGWLKESITQQVLIDKIGVPEKKGEDEYWEAIGTYVQNWEYSNLGIKLEMESENQGESKKVRSITIVQPCKLSTSQGIRIGSDAKIVYEKYFKLIDTSNSNINTIVVGSIYGGIIFTLDEGIVSKIFIGSAAE